MDCIKWKFDMSNGNTGKVHAPRSTLEIQRSGAWNFDVGMRKSFQSIDVNRNGTGKISVSIYNVWMMGNRSLRFLKRAPVIFMGISCGKWGVVIFRVKSLVVDIIDPSAARFNV
jgi:hypothetical protein